MRVKHVLVKDKMNTEYNFDSYVVVWEGKDKEWAELCGNGDPSALSAVDEELRKYALTDEDIHYYFDESVVGAGITTWQTDEFEYETIDEMGGALEVR